MTKFLNRESTHPISPLLLSRVSGRAFSEERLSQEEVLSLFEAARWAPSSYNNQPWRFVYARRGGKGWDTLFNALIDFNKLWCKHADTLAVAISKDHFEHNNKPSVTAGYDTGAAWMSLAVEAHTRNLIAHGMEGFDYAAIKKNLQIPEGFTVLAMLAIGKPGKVEDLPEELRAKEVPSTRKPLQDIVAEGFFPFK